MIEPAAVGLMMIEWTAAASATQYHQQQRVCRSWVEGRYVATVRSGQATGRSCWWRCGGATPVSKAKTCCSFPTKA